MTCENCKVGNRAEEVIVC